MRNIKGVRKDEMIFVDSFLVDIFKSSLHDIMVGIIQGAARNMPMSNAKYAADIFRLVRYDAKNLGKTGVIKWDPFGGIKLHASMIW